MRLLSNISFRRAIALFVAAVILLAAGTWFIVQTTTNHLITQYVQGTTHQWAKFVAENVNDLGDIADGEWPSSASLAFFEATRKSDTVFRYVIFNRYGYSQLVIDHDRIAPVDLSEFSSEAVEAMKTGATTGTIKADPKTGIEYGVAYVAATTNGKAVAAVGAYVDQAEAAKVFARSSWMSAIALFLLTAMAFAVPAVGWYRRTQEKLQADRRIRYLAHHDVLTGIANRVQLIDRLQKAIAILPSTGNMIAVHFFDLDRFKQLNDTLGHDAGDFLLSTIGERLKTMVRLEDVVARLGGDEFVVVQTSVSEPAQAEAFATRLSEVLRAPAYFKEQEICPHLTIGIALGPKDGTTPERLLKSADLALYSGKIAGRGAIRFFTAEMDEALQTRIRLERTIRDAIANNSFVLHYQPILEMNGQKLIGFEALARLNGPDGVPIPPGVFIPMAEEIHVIDKIGEWVLKDACRTAATWQKDLTVAVNLSAAQFQSGDVEQVVTAALEESGLEPRRLELEITESLLLENGGATLGILHRFKEKGISVVMDDFGTGYSSLSYLWKFPFDKIKIDRSFMQSFGGDSRQAETIVKTIIALGREMNMRVTVEGVETSQQVEFLYDYDADQVQGFYFGHPVPSSELSAEVLGAFVKSMAASQDKPSDTPKKAAAG